jgi:hypothetical protein
MAVIAIELRSWMIKIAPFQILVQTCSRNARNGVLFLIDTVV